MSDPSPAPWKSYKDDGRVEIRSADLEVIGHAEGGAGETDAANGRLMAAAPSLLAACQRAIAEARPGGDPSADLVLISGTALVHLRGAVAEAV